MATIGFIGLGNMGAPMAANLVKAGHEVTGFDHAAGRAAALAATGGRAADTAAEAVAAADVVITMLPAGPPRHRPRPLQPARSSSQCCPPDPMYARFISEMAGFSVVPGRMPF